MWLKYLSRFFNGPGFLLLPVILSILLITAGKVCHLIFGDAFFNMLLTPVGIIALIVVPALLFYGISALLNVAKDDDLGTPESPQEKAAPRNVATRSPTIDITTLTTKRTPLWKIVLNSLTLIALILIPFFGVLAIIAFMGIVIFRVVQPSAQSRFMRFQEMLPSSKVRSMTTGMVQLEGKLVAQQQMLAPLSEERCIGYYRCVSEEKRDREGRTHYRIIHEEQCCHPFLLRDSTGSVLVDGIDLDFHLLSANAQQRSGREIEREYIIKQGSNYRLIGNAVRRDDEWVITRDKLHRVFGIAPIGNIQRRKKLDVVFGRARYFLAGTALAIALILAVPIEVKQNQVVIHFEQLFPFSFSFPSL
ncbi:hypothetical protein [Pectobacterium odoriferum]|uniref:hypothetical protein n=1 Tax=Pectobacterium odoriferum TaxID=78398 RepID=UPI001CF2B57B|nr:hypothetical protein [Pectobacterium odoriferum]MCA6963836.1 hypothetical protein [Pectobacterium odoriferum]MCH5011910.1 hypothetical protein [Pectobacterium odoriferum]